MTDSEKMVDTGKNGSTDLWIRGVVKLFVAMAFLALLLFLGAGTLEWGRGWLFLGILGSTMLVNISVTITKNPTLVRERWKRQKGTKSFDKLFGLAYLAANLALFTLAGMDSVRHHWTAMAQSLLMVGTTLHILGAIPVLWSMVTNPHLETTVRIQTDREHKVISSGPYRFVRHPMYVGTILMFLGWPLILGSWVAFGVAWLVVGMFFLRTGLEDKTLREELEGYTEFCTRTRYRLIPGVW